MPKAGAGELQVFKAEFFRALAHPLRIGILEALRSGEHSVGELQAKLGVEQPLLSQQLGVLRTKNILGTQKEGTTVRYFLRDPMVHELLDVARRISCTEATLLRARAPHPVQPEKPSV